MSGKRNTEINSQNQNIRINMTRKERIKKLVGFLKENYPESQIFNSPCIADDYQKCVYMDENDKGAIWAMYAPDYDYIDLYGVKNMEYASFVEGCDCRLKTL